MKTIVAKKEIGDDPDDIGTIVKIAAEAGYKISRGDAQVIWSAYSDEECATWMMVLGSSDEVLRILLKYGDVIDE